MCQSGKCISSCIGHSGGNISAPIQISKPRCKYLNRGVIFKPGGNISTGVQIFKPRWEYLNKGGN